MDFELNGSEIVNGVIAMVVGSGIVYALAKALTPVLGVFPKIGMAIRAWKLRDTILVVTSSFSTLLAIAGLQFAQERLLGSPVEVVAHKPVENEEVREDVQDGFDEKIRKAIESAATNHGKAPTLDTKLTPNKEHSEHALSEFVDMGGGWLQCKKCSIVGRFADYGEGMNFYERAPAGIFK